MYMLGVYVYSGQHANTMLDKAMVDRHEGIEKAIIYLGTQLTENIAW